MKEVVFDESNYIIRWGECKEQYRERFWEDLHEYLLRDVKAAMESQIEEEFEEQIGAEKYERSEERKADRLGKRYRSLETPYGFIQEITIPRARNLKVRFSIFDQWQRIQTQVLQGMLHAYLHGRSGRSAAEIVKQFGHSKYSRNFFHKLARHMEASMNTWFERPIKKTYQYVFIDGMGVKIRDSYLKDHVVIWALGMDEDLNTEVLGYVIAATESEQAVRSLLVDLRNRGMKTPRLFISDESGGIEAAVALEYPHVVHQSCAFHKMKNAGKEIKDKKNRKALLNDASSIYENAVSCKDALIRLGVFCQTWNRKEPAAVQSLRRGFEKTLRYMQFPQEHWKSLYTNNPMESFNSRIRAWIQKYNYFEGTRNLDLALFAYFYTIYGDLVLTMNSQPKNQIPTLLVA